jgi:hypothetical protein
VVFVIASLGALRGENQEIANVALNRAAYQSSAINYDNVAHLATDGSLDTFWQSKVENRPWIYVDLGGQRRISGAQLEWGAAAPGSCTIQVGRGDGPPSAWSDVARASCVASGSTKFSFAPVEARYVRMMADAGSAPGGCQLKEFAVEGDAVPPLPAPNLHLPAADAEGKIPLDGPGWKLQNTLFVHDSGETISQAAYDADAWLTAKVPGTVLTSYLLLGAVPDPDFGDQQKLISESFFQNDFWYRKEILAPALGAHRHFSLDFQGINWKADIYLNGTDVGQIDGAFTRGIFDVTAKLVPGQKNVLAVLIHKCAHPGPTNEKTLKNSTHNGGVLGRDNPTFQASIGWNWIPSIRGRDIGIWDHVFLQESGPVVLVDPFIQTTVSPDRHEADLTLQVTLKNLEDAPAQAVLNGTMGSMSFSQPVALGPNEVKSITLDPQAFSQLALKDPPLWWPNGYGAQPLETMKLMVSSGGVPSTEKDIRFGIRELTYDTSNNILKISCNGQHIQLNGGNWGMDEAMLRYEKKDYDTALRLQKEMHFTMLRNWVGQVGKEEFFDACDKYGILVWNDFWLANPADGNIPDDSTMFLANVRDRIARIRNHPSLALYCGRNEGFPPADLDQGMRGQTSALDGTRFYIPHSANGLVSGFGPYDPQADSWYFRNRGKTLHSELGIVCVPTADSMREMMPEGDLWPIGEMWALHDFFQPRTHTYTQRIDKSYGPSRSVDEFCEKAQLENLENAKAMYEAWRSNSGSGGLVWMSQPAWPSLICQFYDYYLNPTGAYFGARKANEPLHVLWDPAANEVKVANNTGKAFRDLRVEAQIYNLEGTEKGHQTARVDSGSDGVATNALALNFPPDLSPVHFIKLRLYDGDKLVSDNFYWRGVQEDAYQTLNDMPKVSLSGTFSRWDQDDRTHLVVHLKNPGSQVALMACLKVVASRNHTRRVLPIEYDDNYISLLPGEKRDIKISFEKSILKGDRPAILVDGWNVTASEPAGSSGGQ